MATGPHPHGPMPLARKRRRRPGDAPAKLDADELLKTPLTDDRDGPRYADLPEVVAWVEANADRL
jgi:hypothetical protein